MLYSIKYTLSILHTMGLIDAETPPLHWSQVKSILVSLMVKGWAKYELSVMKAKHKLTFRLLPPPHTAWTSPQEGPLDCSL